MQGIYRISCAQESLVYIGASVDIKHRIRAHKWMLKNNKHHSYKLQMSWNAYGDESFMFEVLEETNLLHNREQFWIDEYWPNCYNICKNVENAWSAKNMKTMLASRFRKRQSYGTGNTLTESQVKEIIKEINNGVLHRLIAKKYNIAINSVSSIKIGATWKYLNYLVDNSKADNKQRRNFDKNKAFEMFILGNTRREIQDSLGRSKATICRWHKDFSEQNQ